jgi:hypothetical protein
MSEIVRVWMVTVPRWGWCAVADLAYPEMAHMAADHTATEVFKNEINDTELPDRRNEDFDVTIAASR